MFGDAIFQLKTFIAETKDPSSQNFPLAAFQFSVCFDSAREGNDTVRCTTLSCSLWSLDNTSFSTGKSDTERNSWKDAVKFLDTIHDRHVRPPRHNFGGFWDPYTADPVFARFAASIDFRLGLLTSLQFLDGIKYRDSRAHPLLNRRRFRHFLISTIYNFVFLPQS